MWKLIILLLAVYSCQWIEASPIIKDGDTVLLELNKKTLVSWLGLLREFSEFSDRAVEQEVTELPTEAATSSSSTTTPTTETLPDPTDITLAEDDILTTLHEDDIFDAQTTTATNVMKQPISTTQTLVDQSLCKENDPGDIDIAMIQDKNTLIMYLIHRLCLPTVTVDDIAAIAVITDRLLKSESIKPESFEKLQPTTSMSAQETEGVTQAPSPDEYTKTAQYQASHTATASSSISGSPKDVLMATTSAGAANTDQGNDGESNGDQQDEDDLTSFILNLPVVHNDADVEPESHEDHDDDDWVVTTEMVSQGNWGESEEDEEEDEEGSEEEPSRASRVRALLERMTTRDLLKMFLN